MKDGDQRREWSDDVKDRITNAMASKGLSQRALAAKVGITGSAIAQRLGRENSLKDWWALRCIAEALGMSTDELLGLKPTVGPAPVDRRLVVRALKRFRAAKDADEAAAAALLAALGGEVEQ